ncbi:uncharacterized protein LOC112574722 [Pomacea canaliculata]|uniref:uncharacterized protein LOC112574722 n=1 Tax=Pomacea canaliculata TaxID=400727 RepID=UPI000D730850|nr:uncharacterized protein LOC112574722 [Pomacea canaliculata]
MGKRKKGAGGGGEDSGGGGRVKVYLHAVNNDEAALLTDNGNTRPLQEVKKQSRASEVQFHQNQSVTDMKIIIIRGTPKQIENAVSLINQKTGSKGTMSAQAQIFWVRWVQEAFPDLLSRAYFVPPVHVNRVPMERQTVAGQDVLVLCSPGGQAGQSKQSTLSDQDGQFDPLKPRDQTDLNIQPTPLAQSSHDKQPTLPAEPHHENQPTSLVHQSNQSMLPHNSYQSDQSTVSGYSYQSNQCTPFEQVGQCMEPAMICSAVRPSITPPRDGHVTDNASIGGDLEAGQCNQLTLSEQVSHFNEQSPSPGQCYQSNHMTLFEQANQQTPMAYSYQCNQPMTPGYSLQSNQSLSFGHSYQPNQSIPRAHYYQSNQSIPRAHYYQSNQSAPPKQAEVNHPVQTTPHGQSGRYIKQTPTGPSGQYIQETSPQQAAQLNPLITGAQPCQGNPLTPPEQAGQSSHSTRHIQPCQSNQSMPSKHFGQHKGFEVNDSCPAQMSSSPLPSFQESDVRADKAMQRVLVCLDKMAAEKREIMFVLSQFTFGQYLGEPCYAPAAASMPLAQTLPKASTNDKQGSFDVLVIHRHYGFVVCDVRAIGDSLNMSMSQLDIEIRNKLRNAISKLDKAEAMLSHLVSDIAPGLRITKTIAVPNLTARQVQNSLTGDPQLSQDLCRCLGTTDHANITGLYPVGR